MLSIKNKVYLISSVTFLCSCVVLFFSYSLNVLLLAELILFAFFLRYKVYSEWPITFFWMFFIISECFVTFLENPLNSLWASLFKLFGYIMLCICGFFKQKPLRIKPFEYLIYGVLIFLNTYVVKAIISIVEPHIYLNYIVELYFVLGFTLILLAAFTVRYRLINDSRSKYFALFVAFFTFAEVTSVIAHHLGLFSLCYLEYLFFLLGLTYCVLYSVLENKNDKAFKLIKGRTV